MLSRALSPYAAFLIFVFLTASPLSAFAQFAPARQVRVTFDVRGGVAHQESGTLNDKSSTLGAVGLGFSVQFGRDLKFQRWRFGVAFDVVPLSGETFFDPVLDDDVRIEDDLIIVNPRIGFDIVQKPKADLTLYYGGAAVGVTRTFMLRGAFGDFESVCNFNAFRDECPERWNWLGNAGVSLRYYPKANGRLYVGSDYTRYATGKNSVMGTIGIRF